MSERDVPTWDGVDADDTDPCPLCLGSGTVEDGECPQCEGTGEARLPLPISEPGDDEE